MEVSRACSYLTQSTERVSLECHMPPFVSKFSSVCFNAFICASIPLAIALATMPTGLAQDDPLQAIGLPQVTEQSVAPKTNLSPFAAPPISAPANPVQVSGDPMAASREQIAAEKNGPLENSLPADKTETELDALAQRIGRSRNATEETKRRRQEESPTPTKKTKRSIRSTNSRKNGTLNSAATSSWEYVNWANNSPAIVGAQDYFEFRRLRLVADGTGYGQYDFRLQMTSGTGDCRRDAAARYSLIAGRQRRLFFHERHSRLGTVPHRQLLRSIQSRTSD